jgi:hypothetical protein
MSSLFSTHKHKPIPEPDFNISSQLHHRFTLIKQSTACLICTLVSDFVLRILEWIKLVVTVFLEVHPSFLAMLNLDQLGTQIFKNPVRVSTQVVALSKLGLDWIDRVTNSNWIVKLG